MRRPWVLVGVGALLLLVLALLVGERWTWGAFWLDSIPLRLKMAFRAASPEDLADLGRICNTLNKNECSIRAYGRIVAAQKNNVVALANLAMAQTRAHRYADALANYEAVLRLGGSSADVFYWYAVTLKELGKTQEAISWYYKTLQVDPDYLDVTDELIQLLIQNKRPDEALGVVGAFLGRQPDSKQYFASTLVMIDNHLAKPPDGLKASESLKVPAIGHLHFLPFRITDNGPYAVGVVDTGASYLTLSPAFVRDSQLLPSLQVRQAVRLQTANGVVLASIVLLPTVHIGRFTLKNVEAAICNCPVLLGQFSSPIVLLLLGATAISLVLRDTTDAAIILVLVVASGLLGFWQERGAAGAVEKLLSLVEVNAQVLRGGTPQGVPLADVVPGDVVLLSAGATAPGDCLLLEARDLFADEATLTGETFPAEKAVAVLPGGTPLGQRTNAVFLGTHMVSGSATAVVAAIGRDTEFGAVADRLKLRPPETDFERGVRRFGYLLMEVTLLLVIGIFAFNVYLHRPVLDSFLFSMALAVGLTPQLLPAIVSINLAQGARRMCEHKVIVKRLAAIENFGSMDVLCTDKTGTITEGVVTLQSVTDLGGQESALALRYAYLNASFQTGFSSPIDEAIRKHGPIDIAAWKKLDEVPYDFLRKRLSVLAAGPEGTVMITKGALAQVLEVCTTAEDRTGRELRCRWRACARRSTRGSPSTVRAASAPWVWRARSSAGRRGSARTVNPA
jgi:P-type E1-E2 ATPase